MAGRLMKLLFRPGWRMKCIDPPLGWVRVLDELPPVAEIRLQLTCFLTQDWASPVLVREAQLRVVAGDRDFIVPWARSLLESAIEPIPVKFEGLFNAAIEFREVADLDLTVSRPLLRGSEWQRAATGRELTK